MWPDTPADQLPVRSITNGVHVPTWMAGPVFALLDQSLRPRLARSRRRARVVGAPQRHSRCRDLGDAPDAAARTCSPSSASACARGSRRSTSARAALSSAGAMLDPEALTLGYARRFTAYKRPELIFHDADRLARILNAHRSAGADRVRRQGASRRRAGEASPAAGLQARARSEVRRPPRLHRRLRHARRALPGAGLRRVAEQPAQAARSQRHQRHEGVAERRAAPQHRRRLVGRRLQRPQRLADRGPGQPRRPRGDRCRRRQRALRRCWRTRSCRRSTIATGTAAACRGAGSRSCARRCARTCRGSRRGAWSSSTSRRCTARPHARPSIPQSIRR